MAHRFKRCAMLVLTLLLRMKFIIFVSNAATGTIKPADMRMQLGKNK
jgi:hypothetical protein